jgi:hypothetical protein
MNRAQIHALALTAAVLLASRVAAAQDEMPAVNSPVTERPVVAKPASPTPAVDAAADKTGTDLLGDRDESPFGLTFIPWREAHAEKDIDRPARLLQEKPVPVDRVVFNRQVEYYEALTAELKKKGVVTPVAR